MFVCDYLKEEGPYAFYRKKQKRRNDVGELVPSWRSQKKQVNFRELFFFADQVHSM